MNEDSQDPAAWDFLSRKASHHGRIHSMTGPPIRNSWVCNKFPISDLFLQENWGRIHYKFLSWHRPVSCLFRVFFLQVFVKGFGLSYLGDASMALPSGTFGQHPKKQFQAAQWPTQKRSVKGSLAHPSPSEMLLEEYCLFCGIKAWVMIARVF